MRDPLLAPAAFLCLGIALARFVPFHPLELALAALAFLALAVLARKLPSAALPRLLACTALGALLLTLRPPPPPPTLDATAQETVLLEGCVVEPPAFSETREQFVLELAPRARARVTLYPREDEPLPRLSYGQRVEVEGRARPPRNFQNPGAFDVESYLARRDIYWTVSARAARVLPGDCGQPSRALLYSWRTAALDRLDALYAGRPYSAAMMKATLIGDTATLDQLWTENFRRTGTYHALVISGLHVTVLAGVLLFFLRIAAAPPLLALFLTSALAWLYALLAGLQPPVLRAAAGFTLFAVARFFFRRGRILNLLAAVTIAVLAADPHQLFEASFQLSFASVALLGAFAVPLIEATTHPFALGLRGLPDLARDPHLPPRIAQFRIELRLAAEALRLPTPILALPLRLLFWLWEMFVISAIAQTGILVLMVLYFHRLSWTGISANLFVIPAMSLAVPLGFLAVFANLSLPAQAAEALLLFSRWITDLHARWESPARIPDPPAWLIASAVVSLAVLYCAIRRAPRWTPLAAAPFLASVALIVLHPFQPHFTRGALELTAIDVGQGESLLVAFPDGRLMLIDGGGLPVFGKAKNRPRPRLDIGEDVVSPYLWSRSIRSLDIIVATHGHEDHTGGLPAVIANFRPRELWLTAGAPSPLRALGVPIRELRAGYTQTFAGATVETLDPQPDYQPGDSAHNEDSLVLRLSYGRHKLLLTGDREGPLDPAPVDVLKVAHHGGRRGTPDEFLDGAKPAVALISAGLDNMYRLPHPALLDRLASRRIATWRTDHHGLVTVRSNGRHLTVSHHP